TRGRRWAELPEYVTLRTPWRHDAALIRALMSVDMSDRGGYLGAGPKRAILRTIEAQCGCAEGARPPDRCSRLAVTPPPRLTRAAMAALAALVGTGIAAWPGLVTAQEAPSSFSRSSASGSFLAARHAGGQKDAAAAASYYRAALRGDPRNNELLN